jgi:NAD(P)-dependent dehydrogenase (short-subunit alcohol dehydrogenase family)
MSIRRMPSSAMSMSALRTSRTVLVTSSSARMGNEAIRAVGRGRARITVVRAESRSRDAPELVHRGS